MSAPDGDAIDNQSGLSTTEGGPTSHRDTIDAGLADLRLQPALTVAAMLASAAGVLALLAGGVHADALVRAAIARDRTDLLLAALRVALLASTVGTLTTDLAQACALAGYTGTRGFVPTLRAGLERVIPIVTVTAIEVGVYVILGELATVAFVTAPLRPGPLLALYGALLVTPPLALSVLTFLAARLAVVRAARGEPAGQAFAAGVDLVFRRLPTVVGFALAFVGRALPILTAALGLAVVARYVPETRIAVAALSAVLGSGVTLWLYASVALFAERETIAD